MKRYVFDCGSCDKSWESVTEWTEEQRRDMTAHVRSHMKQPQHFTVDIDHDADPS